MFRYLDVVLSLDLRVKNGDWAKWLLAANIFSPEKNNNKTKVLDYS